MLIELIVGVGVDQWLTMVQMPGVPRVGDFVHDHDGDQQLGTVYAVNWFVDADFVQVRVQ